MLTFLIIYPTAANSYAKIIDLSLQEQMVDSQRLSYSLLLLTMTSWFYVKILPSKQII